MALTIHYIPPTFETFAVPADYGIQLTSNRGHSMIVQNLAEHEVLSKVIVLRVGHDSPMTEETHVLVPMKTAVVPLLTGAQAEAVKAAWAPWRTMSKQNREKVHEQVMRVLREIEADFQIIRELQEVVENLKLELEDCRLHRQRRAVIIQEHVQNITAMFTT